MKAETRKRVKKLLLTGLCVGVLSGCGQAVTEGETVSHQNSIGIEESGSSGTVQAPVEPSDPTAEPAAATEVLEETGKWHTYQTKTEEGSFFDEEQNPLGPLLTRQIIVYRDNNPEDIVIRSEVIWPEIDVSFDGADAINDVLWEYAQGFTVEMPSEDEEWEPSITGVHQFYESIFSGFSYRDDHYISFLMHGYDFFGGVHGMPYRRPYTFHLQTGKQLMLTDIIDISEDELKAFVGAAFEEKVRNNPEGFYSVDAADIVREMISLDSEFVLTPEGILFYLYPYDIAPYAEGFPEVVIPYEEFIMKIKIGE